MLAPKNQELTWQLNNLHKTHFHISYRHLSGRLIYRNMYTFRNVLGCPQGSDPEGRIPGILPKVEEEWG